MLGQHLGIGVTGIYWYFRKKDDLLDVMTDRALSENVFATPYVEASDWRETLLNCARLMRKTFMGTSILILNHANRLIDDRAPARRRPARQPASSRAHAKTTPR